jgi:hypothetical protein
MLSTKKLVGAGGARFDFSGGEPRFSGRGEGFVRAISVRKVCL